MKGKIRALTVSALCAALGTVILALSLLLPMQRLALLCAASLGVVASLCMNGEAWALCTYAGTALLSFLLLPEKTMPLAYGLFCGYYPVLKLKLEALSSGFGRLALKLLCFNAAFAVFYVLIRLTVAFPLGVLVAIANGAFLLYDYALGKLILLYIRKIGRRVDHG